MTQGRRPTTLIVDAQISQHERQFHTDEAVADDDGTAGVAASYPGHEDLGLAKRLEVQHPWEFGPLDGRMQTAARGDDEHIVGLADLAGQHDLVVVRVDGRDGRLAPFVDTPTLGDVSTFQ